jgi:amino acid transporter
VLAYGTAPLALGALRKQEPDRERPYRLPGGSVLAPIAFVIANLVLLFSGFAVVWKLIVAVIIGFILLGISAGTSKPQDRPQIDWRSGMWLWPYLIGMVVISYLSSFDTSTPSKVALIGLKGPVNDLHFGWDVLVTAIFSLIIYAFAIRLRLPAEQTREYVGDLTQEAEEIEAELAESAV